MFCLGDLQACIHPVAVYLAALSFRVLILSSLTLLQGLLWEWPDRMNIFVAKLTTNRADVITFFRGHASIFFQIILFTSVQHLESRNVEERYEVGLNHAVVVVGLQDFAARFLASHDWHVQVENDDVIVMRLLNYDTFLDFPDALVGFSWSLETLPSLLILPLFVAHECVQVLEDFFESFCTVYESISGHRSALERSLYMVFQHAQLDELVVHKHQVDFGIITDVGYRPYGSTTVITHRLGLVIARLTAS